jgi:gluconolactonase
VSVLEGKRVTTLASIGGNPNGLALGPDGRIWATRGRGVLGDWRAEALVEPAIVVVDPATGSAEVVATTADGLPLRAPNDLCFGPDGALWFTDPDDYEPEAPIHGWICRLDSSGTSRVHELANTFPNGLAFDSEGRLVWVESIARRVVLATEAGPQVVATFADDAVPDGCAYTSDGRLAVATLHSGAIDVISWQGVEPELERLMLPPGTALTNIAFSGSDLWATDVTVDWAQHETPTGRLWRLSTDAEGLPLL